MEDKMARIKTHPGEVLKEDFLKPLKISINKLARDLDVPPSRISNIVNEKRDVTTDTAFRLGKYFGTSAKFWMNLQAAHSLSVFEAKEGIKVSRAIRARDISATDTAQGGHA
jgi:addiction module HigA family antidote